MNILGIVCSPRPGGNTSILMETALASAVDHGADVEMLIITDKILAPCDGCESCAKTRKCRIDDDMQEIYVKMLMADGIIFGTPVYFWNMSSQAKMLVDRTFALYHGRRLRNKVAGVIAVAGRAGATNTFTTFHDFFNIHRMVSVSGALGYLYEEEIGPDERGGGVIAYAMRKGDVRQDTGALAQAKALGKAMVKSIAAIKSMY